MLQVQGLLHAGAMAGTAYKPDAKALHVETLRVGIACVWVLRSICVLHEGMFYVKTLRAGGSVLHGSCA